MSILAQADLARVLVPAAFSEQAARAGAALAQLAQQAAALRRGIVFVFEGWDAAGQGDAIGCLVERLDPRQVTLCVGAAYEAEDAARHSLYRFWRHLPERGAITIFDGSWYGRALAERVEGRSSDAAWWRACWEIDQFERQLTDFGVVVIKFWLHISAAEQARRLAARAESSTQIEERGRCEAAVEEMLLKTSALNAPWTIVEAEDTLWAQAKVLQTTVDTLSAAFAEGASDSRTPGGAGKKVKPKG